MNSIVTLQTGTPFYGVDFENDTSLTGEFSDRWNVIGNTKSIPNFSTTGPVPVEQVLAQPEFGNFGNSGRNTFRGPKFKNWDFSLVKIWKATERVSVQLRGEFFNVLNHPNFANPVFCLTTIWGFGHFWFSDRDGCRGNKPPVIGTEADESISLVSRFGTDPVPGPS